MMPEEKDSKTLIQLADEARKEPVTTRDRIIASAIALALIAFCIGTWMNPDLISIDASQFSGRAGRKIAFFLNILWSRPAGSIGGLAGVLLVWGIFSRKTGESPNGKTVETKESMQ